MIDILISHLKENKVNMEGCSNREIEKLSSHYNVKFPLTYSIFLKTMGRSAGRFMEGSSVFYNELFELQDGAKEIIEENELPPLPEDSFVFWMHQGYQMAFFKLTEGQDPPVYFFSENEDGIETYTKVSSSISEYLISQLLMSGLPEISVG